MMLLNGIVGFFLMIGILIFIHELGHFLMAKAFGVKVEVFSLGFVGRLVSFRWGETRYQIGWLPLGGYVRMYGDHDADAVPPTMRAYAFSHKPLWQRALIVLAGPFANLVVLPLLAFGILYGTQTKEISTVIGTVIPEAPAAKAGLRPGDKIVSIDGQKTLYFRDLLSIIGRSSGKKLTVGIEREGKPLSIVLTPREHTFRDVLGTPRKRGVIGVTADYRLPEIGVADPSKAAYKAGLRTWDRLISIDGQIVRRWEDIAAILQKEPAKPRRYRYQRPLLHEGPVFRFTAFLPEKETLVTPIPRIFQGQTIYDHGIWSSELFLQGVIPGSPFAKAGLRAGDRLVALAGRPLHVQADLSALPSHKGRNYPLVYQREGRLVTTSFALEPTVWVDPLKQKHQRLILGHRLGRPYALGEDVAIQGRLSYALQRAWEDTWQIADLLVAVLGKMFNREISTETIGGPIMIFQIAQEAVKSGWETFLRHMALISINLGIINLLPIPLLDGGHLVFFLIEGIIRRPIPPRVRENALLVGLFFLLVLMFLGFRNDILRTFFS